MVWVDSAFLLLKSYPPLGCSLGSQIQAAAWAWRLSFNSLGESSHLSLIWGFLIVKWWHTQAPGLLHVYKHRKTEGRDWAVKQEVQNGGCWHRGICSTNAVEREAAGGERQPHVIAWGCGCTALIFKSWRSWLSFFQNRLSEEVGVGELGSVFLTQSYLEPQGFRVEFWGNLCCGNWNSGLTYCSLFSIVCKAQDTTKGFLRQWSRKKWGVLFSILEPTNQFCKTVAVN